MTRANAAVAPPFQPAQSTRERIIPSAGTRSAHNGDPATTTSAIAAVPASRWPTANSPWCARPGSVLAASADAATDTDTDTDTTVRDLAPFCPGTTQCGALNQARLPMDPAAYQGLTGYRDWTPRNYERWFAAGVSRLLLV